MNRQWPAVTSWTLVALTLAAIVGDILFGRLALWVNYLAAAAAFAQLCIQRHTQQAILASAVMLAVLSVCLYPATFNALDASNFGAFGLLVGSRGIARLRLVRHTGPRGYRVIALGSLMFGPGVNLLLYCASNPWNSMKPWQGLLLVIAATLAGALAQLLAVPGLVKVIPERQDDEKPAIAVWLLLVAWSALSLTRQD